MNLSFTMSIPQGQLGKLERDLSRKVNLAPLPVNLAMAQAFQSCVKANFGYTGWFRPKPWVKLTKAYARKVGRSVATLFVSGRLMNSVKAGADKQSGAVAVSKTDVIYALAHQFGYERGGQPARPYFPIHDDGEVTSTVQRICLNAAREQVLRIFRR